MFSGVGKRGPKKQPVAVKEQRGTREKHRDPDPVPAVPGVPPCPFPAKSPEAKTWETLVQVMTESRLTSMLSASDLGMLEMTALAWCRFRQASKYASKIPVGKQFIMTKANGLRPHPAFAHERAAWAEFRKCAAEFGLSPSARSSIPANTPKNGAGAAPGDMDGLLVALMAQQPVEVG